MAVGLVAIPWRSRFAGQYLPIKQEHVINADVFGLSQPFSVAK